MGTEKPAKPMMNLLDRLWDIPRSITGEGVRKTLRILNEYAPIRQSEFPTGLKVLDWIIPQEWNIRDAYVMDRRGRKLIDFKKSNLHLVSYSVPMDGTVKKEELLKHLHTLPDIPDAIPYRTSYYKKDWGFCLAHRDLKKFRNKEYRVVIDSELKKGFLTIGEGFIKGHTDEEILFSTYVCHPSLANNELSGPIVLTFLYQELLKRPKGRYSYRFLYVPETIGAITYLAHHGKHLQRKLKAGYVVTCVGDRGHFTYKKSRQGNSLADRAALHVLKTRGAPYKVLDWFPAGSDERQYGSPGFNLPVGALVRSVYEGYPQYHSSLDNKQFVSEEKMRESVDVYAEVVDSIEINDIYLNAKPYGEPQLGRRGLYTALGGRFQRETLVSKFLWLLGYGDGKHDILDIADKLKLPARELKDGIEALIRAGLLVKKHHRR